MSRLNFSKILSTNVATPGANRGEVYYNNTLLPPGPCWVDETGVVSRLFPVTMKLTNDLPVNFANPGSWVSVPGLAFYVVSATLYHFRFGIVFQSGNTGNGISLRLNQQGIPGSYNSFGATTRSPSAADGTAAEYTANLSNSADEMRATSVEATGTSYLAMFEGVLNPSVSGMIQPQYASTGGGGSSITVKQGSFGMMWEL